MIASLTALSWEDQLALAAQVNCPHLLLEAQLGPKDPFWLTMVPEFRYQNSQMSSLNLLTTGDSRAHNPRFQHEVVPGLHHVHLNQPDVINPKVVNFITKSVLLKSKI